MHQIFPLNSNFADFVRFMKGKDTGSPMKTATSQKLKHAANMGQMRHMNFRTVVQAVHL
jgi:hypothetical protein